MAESMMSLPKDREPGYGLVLNWVEHQCSCRFCERRRSLSCVGAIRAITRSDCIRHTQRSARGGQPPFLVFCRGGRLMTAEVLTRPALVYDSRAGSWIGASLRFM